MRTDTEFNPGNSGGALIDGSCHLVGVSPPPSRGRSSRSRSRAPRSGFRTVGVKRWPRGLPSRLNPPKGCGEIGVLTDTIDADSGDDFGRGRDLRYYRLPAARPGVATVSPRLVIGTMGPGRTPDPRRSGRGPDHRVGFCEYPCRRDGPPGARRPHSGRARAIYAPPSRRRGHGRHARRGPTRTQRGRVSRPGPRACATYVAWAPAGVDVVGMVAEVQRAGTIGANPARGSRGADDAGR